MNTTNYIRIFRGDDSDALGYQTIVGTIKTDLDLTGCKAVFRFLGFYAEFDPIPEDKKLTIVIPAQASRGFPPGVGYASLKVLDALGKIRTFTNRIPVIVDTMTPSCGCGEFEVSFSPFPELEPLKIFVGPNADDFDQYTGFISKIIDRASLTKYGLVMLADAMSEDGGNSGKAASPAAVKAAYDAIIGVLADNYYTAEQTDEAIDRVAAYYITYTAAGAAFPTYAALANATTVYSGGKVRVPTRNDYCVVLADETHQGAEYRYIYAVAEGQTTGSWQPQFPVEGVMTVDQTVTKNSTNPVSGGGVWSAIWGTATTAFTSIYDWVVDQLAKKLSLSGGTMDSTAKITWSNSFPGSPTYSISRNGIKSSSELPSSNWTKLWSEIAEISKTIPTSRTINGKALSSDVTLTGADIAVSGSDPTKIDAALAGKASKSDVDPLLFAQYYPEGNVKSAAEFTPGIKYGSFDDVHRTVSVLPFCNTGDSANDNSGLVGRVVIPPFVDAQGNGYISDDGTRFKVVGVSGGTSRGVNTNLTAIIAPNTVATIGEYEFNACTALISASFPAVTTVETNAFRGCTGLISASFPAVTTVEASALRDCTSMTSASLPAAQSIGNYAFRACTSLISVSLPAATTVEANVFSFCTALTSVDFGDTSRPSVPTLGTDAFNGVPTSCKIIVPYTQYDAWIAAEDWRDLPQEFVRHAEKADKPATFTEGNLAKFDANGNPTDSGKKPSDFQSALTAQQLANIEAVPSKANDADVVHKTGDETIAGNKTFSDGVAITGDNLELLNSAYPEYNFSLGTDSNGRIYFVYRRAAVVPAIGLAYKSEVDAKADASDLPYAISESIPLTVTSGAAATTLDDRTHNVRTVAAPGSGNTTTITATLPPIVAGKSRDMFLNLKVGTQASDAGDISLSIVEPSGATVQIDIGSVEDIGIGKNEILISENALPTTSGNVTTTHWLVTVRHEDFAS